MGLTKLERTERLLAERESQLAEADRQIEGWRDTVQAEIARVNALRRDLSDERERRRRAIEVAEEVVAERAREHLRVCIAEAEGSDRLSLLTHRDGVNFVAAAPPERVEVI